MNNVVNVPGQVGPSGAPGISSGEVAATEGRFRGERVQHLRNPTAELEDAAEELTFGESERVEKKLSKRKLASGHGARSVAMEQARKYLREVPDLERTASSPNSSIPFSREAARPIRTSCGSSPASSPMTPPTSTWHSPRSGSRRGERNADPVLGAALDEAIAALEGENGPAIQAGLNVSAVAQAFAGREIGDIQQLRDLYREVVLDCEDINAAFQRVVEDHPGKSFDEAVRFMLKALGADLAAGTQTVSGVRLKRIMDDMYQLKSLNSVHEQCEDLLRRGKGTSTPLRRPRRRGTSCPSC